MAETTNTYTWQPPTRSVYSPPNDTGGISNGQYNIPDNKLPTTNSQPTKINIEPMNEAKR